MESFRICIHIQFPDYLSDLRMQILRSATESDPEKPAPFNCDTRYNCMGKFQYHSGASLRESAIEAYLLEHIDSVIESAQVNLYMDAGNASPKPARSAQSVQEELNRLNTMYQKGRLSEEYYDREYERLTALLSTSDDRQLEEKAEASEMCRTAILR